MLNYSLIIGSKEQPIRLRTPSLDRYFTIHLEESDGKDILVCTVGGIEFGYFLECVEDFYWMLKKKRGDWIFLGAVGEFQKTKKGTVEHWARSLQNPKRGWYGITRNHRGNFGDYIPPLMEYLGLAELTHLKKNNKIRCIV